MDNKMNESFTIKSNSYIDHEEAILNDWDEINLFNKITEDKVDKKEFSLCDGPPFVTGNLHFGHLLISYLKSTVIYYKAMQKCTLGMKKNGVDCHGVPIELVLNKKLNITNRKEILEMGIDKYNLECKKMVSENIYNWQPIFRGVARLLTFNEDGLYKTLDLNFMESEWWAFSEIYKKGLVYKGYKIMPYSVGCETSLSNFEATQNYKEIETKSVYVLFKIKDENKYFLVWTTTPWTLPSNIALCVNPEGKYIEVKLKGFDNKIIIIEESFLKNVETTEITDKTHMGKDLVGIEYENLFNLIDFKFHKVLADNYVELQNSINGSGIVHLAPSHGEDDFRVCIENKAIEINEMEKINLVDDEGYYEFNGVRRRVIDKEMNDEIIKNLKSRGLLYKTQMISHSYPFCYRTDLPLIYKAQSSWFIKVTAIKDELLKKNEEINWYPSHIGAGRFKKWLENVKDWNVSRNRFFGTPLPIWRSDDDDEIYCVSSIDELCELAGIKERPIDLHLEFINKIQIPSKKTPGKFLKLDGSIFDCWFDSACVPFAQFHYPFENKERVDKTVNLSDCGIEGLDQCRGWFYTTLVVSTAIFNKLPMKNIICTGLIMDEKGVKFSKKYGNFKDPMETLKKYGSDYLRIYLLNSPVSNADMLYFKEENIDRLKQRVIPYINAAKLLVIQIIDYTKKGNKLDIELYKTSKNEMDNWIISRIGSLSAEIEKNMDNYEVSNSIAIMINFIDEITNWYIKLNRDRLRGLNGDEETSYSLSTLNCVIMTYNKLLAPFMPLLSEYIYKNIKNIQKENKESILLETYPKSNEFKIDDKLENKFKRISETMRLIRSVRYKLSKHSSLKAPVAKLCVLHNNEEYINDIKSYDETIREELNILETEYYKLSDNINYRLEPNRKNLGKKYKSKASNYAKYLQNLDCAYIKSNLEEIKTGITIDENKLDNEDYEIISIPNSELFKDMESLIEGELMISLDKRYDESIHETYMIRSLITGIQRIRRNAGLNPWNEINIYINSEELFMKLLETKKADLEERLKAHVKLEEYESDIYADGDIVLNYINQEEIKVNIKIERLS